MAPVMTLLASSLPLPPLVLLPGTLCDARVFAPLLRALQDRFPELSAAVLMTAEHESLREAAEAVLLRAPERFVLLGFSLGGLVALEVALLAPERVRALVLMNVNVVPAPPLTHEARRDAVREAEAIGVGKYVQQRLWPRYVAPRSLENTGLRELVTAMAEEVGHAGFRSQTEAALARRDYRPLAPALRMPALVQAGELDEICPVALQQELAAALGDAAFEVIPGAGHFSLLEEQDAVARSVAGWFHTVFRQEHP